ncbi:MAG: prephenate dehydrogenase, partial [Bacteroidales bacterium]|nr:prephenate dehydrogenase [Bacteroidales bacterium]
KDTKILIVGLGLIGGSYARALSRQGYYVGGISRSQETVDYALKNGFIATGSTEVSQATVSGYDLVVLALYPSKMSGWIKKYQHLIKDGAVITDVSGVKCSIVYKIQEMLRPGLEFISAHPMAGREKSGIRNADDGVFRGANYLVTPTAANSEAAIQLSEELGRTLGFSRISRISPELHDEMIAFLSQLTHCIAVALMTCRDCTHFSAYTGDSFRDLTRIARINDEMWSELFTQNKEQLLTQMDLFSGQLSRLRDAVARGDIDTMREMMKLSTERRAYFDK